MSKPVKVLCIYRVPEKNEAEFARHLKLHWPTLDSVGLCSSEPARYYRGMTESGDTAFIEIFEWKDESSAGAAHETPEVMKVWEPMGTLTSGMEFIDIEPIQV